MDPDMNRVAHRVRPESAGQVATLHPCHRLPTGPPEGLLPARCPSTTARLHGSIRDARPSMNRPPSNPRHPAVGPGVAKKVLSALIGDPHRFPLEHRLFNSVGLLNAVTNIGGVATLFLIRDSAVLVALNLGIGLVFLGFYLLSRFGGRYRPLYWPFVVTIAVFLFANILFNAGSNGGAVWYLVPGLVIAVALSARTRDAVISGMLFGGTALGVLAVEMLRPGWIHAYATSGDRLTDVAANMLFAQLFTGGLVLLYAKSLNAERHRSDVLLLNVLPRPIADELKRTSRVVPVHYDAATVLFSDFVGFTGIAENLTPTDLIARLDRSFQEFDALVQADGLEKIKTIGDAYLAVGGIPVANRTHPVDCVLAALAMVRATDRLRVEHEARGEPAWGIRIGIHTGPLVAGVIGTEKFAYDVWGDTVNTASRLESSGVPGRVNLSESTYQRVRDFFECEHRGQVAAKGKGEIGMFLVVGLRPEFTDDGIEPNARFKARLAAG